MVEQSFFRSPPFPNPQIVVVGGGITGLACAFQLQHRSNSKEAPCRVTLLEASERVGGKILTDRIEGFTIDAGADVFMARKPGAVALCRALNIADRIQETDPSHRKTYVRQPNGSLQPITMYENEPLATLRGGMQELAETTAKHLTEGTIRYGAEVVGIEQIEQTYRVHVSQGQSLDADAVVLALPARQTASVLKSLIPNTDTARLLSGVSYTKTTTVSAAFHITDVPHSLDGYGYIVKDAPAGSVSACTWSSSKIPGRAPDRHVLLRAFIRGVDLPTERLHELVLQEFRQTLGVIAAPIFIRSYQWPEAIPIYAATHDQHIAELDQDLRPFPGLTIAGSAIGATGIPDSIRSGMEAADAVWEYVMSGVWPGRDICRDATMVTQTQSFFAR